MAQESNSNKKFVGMLFVLSFALFVYYNALRGPEGGLIMFVNRATLPSDSPIAKGGMTNGLVQGADIDPARCTERLQPSYGSCGYFLGVHYSGTNCQRVYGCTLSGAQPPFFDVGACEESCGESN